MREVGGRFTPPPGGPGTLIEDPGLRVVWRGDLFQMLIGGNLAAAGAAIGITGPTTGLFEIAPVDTAMIRICRDQMLFVGTGKAMIAEGWRDVGWAATHMDDGYAVLEISGVQTSTLLQEGLRVDFERGGPSAATQFVECWALIYRISQTTVRLHLEAPNLPYVTQWIQSRLT